MTRSKIPFRFDLIPPVALRRVAAIYEEGAQVYGDSSYIEQKQRMSTVINHLYGHLTSYACGDRSEDHFAKVAWAALTLVTLDSVYGDEEEGPNDICEYGIRIRSGTTRHPVGSEPTRTEDKLQQLRLL